MSRRKKKKKIRKIFYYGKYDNFLVYKFTNMIMKSGKKSKAEKIIKKIFDLIKEKYNKNPIEIFNKCLKNARPYVFLKKKKVGGSFFLIPIKSSKKMGYFVAMKNIIKNSLIRKEKIHISIFKEIIETYNNESNTIKNKDEIHEKAKLNRAFSHFYF